MPIDRVVAVEQRFGEVRADEAGGAGDDHAFFIGDPTHRWRSAGRTSVGMLVEEARAAA